MIEKLVEIGILFDFYGKLLSTRQFAVVELFYIHDLSLSEIGEELDVTRQSIYDTLKRAEKKLYEYEESLELVEDFKKNTLSIKSIIEISEELLLNIEDNNEFNIENIASRIKSIKKLGKKVLENSREVGN